MDSFLMERIFQSTHNGVLTAHTWVVARCATEAFQSHLCSTYRGLWGWWLSTCCSSVVDHWLHKSGVLGSIPRSCQPFCFPLFSPQNILILFIPEKLSHKRTYSKLSMPKYDVNWLKGLICPLFSRVPRFFSVFGKTWPQNILGELNFKTFAEQACSKLLHAYIHTHHNGHTSLQQLPQLL